jgi:membrane protein insertase Oxa1/YidC/SpoIIIJ
MTHEGALWFTDLTMPDPLYGLPIICAAATLAMVRSGSFGDAMGQMPGGNADTMKKIMTGAAFIMIPAGGYASSAIALLWASNALFSAGQNMLLAHPGVRRLLGLPIKGVVEQPKSAAEGGSWIEQLVPQLKAYNPFGAKKRREAAAAAAAAAAAPPPGRVAVNYVPNRPRRKGNSS